MKKRDNFNIIEPGTSYEILKYRVVDGIGTREVWEMEEDECDTCYQKIIFVRGDKTDNGNVIPRVDGITHEQLLGMMIADLQFKNNLIPSRETSIAITKLQEALMWIEERQRDRESRNVIDTYQK